MTVNLLTTALPFFPGFYNSVLETIIDAELESLAEMEDTTVGAALDEYSMSLAMNSMTRCWVESFASWAKLDVTFESVQSPKEYNFTTDRAFAFIPEAEAKRLHLAVFGLPVFDEVLRRRFTSYDGFASFYPNHKDAPEWREPVAKWDHNHLLALVEAWCRHIRPHLETRYIFEGDVSELSEAAADGWNQLNPVT
jgi:hypothetical protein